MNDRKDAAATESLVDLPAAVDAEFDVYVNGILQKRGIDYRLEGRILVFPRRLVPEVKLTKLQLLRAVLGIAGTYGKYDCVDVAYQHAGRNLVATGLEPRDVCSG